MRQELQPIWSAMRQIGYRGKLGPFGFTLEETLEAIEEEQEEDDYISEIEEDWRKQQLTPDQREEVFKESGVKEEDIFEMKRKGIMNRAESFFRKYYEKKTKGESIKEMESQKRSFVVVYDILTGRRKQEITDYMVQRANERELKSVVELLGFKIIKNKILCPFHQEKTPSLHITKNLWHCFGCNEEGNTIKFIQKYLNFSFKEAIKYLQ